MFDMNELLDTVLHLLVDNLGFSRMTVFVHHPDRNCASLARVIGVSPDIGEAIRRIDIPVVDNGGITAELLLHGKPLLIQDIETVTQRMYPPILEMARWPDARWSTA